MFNNNYGYGGYNPQAYLGAYQQPQMQVQQKIMGFNYASEDEIKGYFLSPNAQILALDKEQPFFYIKTADSLGRSTFTKYKFEQVLDDAEERKPDYLTKQDLEGLASKEELQALREQYKQLEARFLRPKTGGIEHEQSNQ